MPVSDFVSRRHLLAGMGALSVPALIGCTGQTSTPRLTASPIANPVSQHALPGAGEALSALEQRVGGRLGVSVLMPVFNVTTGWRASESFAMRSTLKLPVAGFVLEDVDKGLIRLDQTVQVTERDLRGLSRDLADVRTGSMVSVDTLMRVMLTLSNNPATDMLLGLIGGVPAFHARLTALGDTTTRLDNLERAFSAAGQESTTPQAMGATVASMLKPGFLSDQSRQRLQDWMVATETGSNRLRAGFDPSWVAGDKTGTGGGPDGINRINDVAVIWFSAADFVVVSSYYESPVRSAEIRPEDYAVLAEAGRIIANWVRDVRR
jgi:beta-lactamase class A